MPRRVGRYELQSVLSSGGMATVHLGRLLGETGFQRVVAIKRIHEGLANDRELRAMLRDEAHLLARVRHASVVTTLDVIEDGDELFLVMEYVHGATLAMLARGESPLPLPIVSAIVGDVLEGLHAAHEAGVVHRDVSPENVMVGVDGVARVLDFGIAYAAGRSQRTMPGHIKGKPAYMAPEQAQGEEVDRRADVYATSVMLWELLTGTRLFPADSPAGAMLRHLEEIPKPPSTRRDVPSSLDAIALRGLAKQPSDRFATARAMAEALDAAVPRASRAEVGTWIEEHAAALLAERAALLEPLEEEPASSRTLSPPPRPRTWLRPLALGAAALVGLTALAWRRTDPPARPAAAALPIPRGTHAEPVKMVVPPVQADDLELEAALTAMVSDIVNDSPETITGGLRRTRAAARALQPEGTFTPATWMAAAAQVGAPAVLVTTARDGKVSVQLVEPKTKTEWFSRSAPAPNRDDTLGALADLVLALREALGDSSTPAERTRAAAAFRGTTITAAAAYAHASDQTASGSWDDALREANAAVAADPNFPMARFAQALAYGNAGRNEDAERSYRVVLAQPDRLSEANRLLASGLYFTVRREPPQAIEQLQKYTLRYPANFGGAMDLANAYFTNRDMTSAEKEGRRAYELGKAPVALANCALYAAFAGDFESAIRDANTVLGLGGDSAETAALALAHAELGAGVVGDIHAAYSKLGAQGSTAASRAALGEADLALAEDRLADAEHLLREGEGTAPKRAALAETLLRLNRRGDALAEADRLAADSQDPAILLTLGRLYAEAHLEAPAAAIAKRLEARVDHESRAYAALVRGDVLLESGHARDSIAHFEEARKAADPWLARFDLGRAYLALGMPIEAAQELEACQKREGEALALFLDDVPTYRFWVRAPKELARARATTSPSR